MNDFEILKRAARKAVIMGVKLELTPVGVLIVATDQKNRLTRVVTYEQIDAANFPVLEVTMDGLVSELSL